MIGRKHKRGRLADIAVFAPLVLLPFVWFATTACFDILDRLANPPPDATYGGMPVYNYPDQTRFGGGDDALACTTSGGYIGGGANDEATRANIQSSVEQNKRKISDIEGKMNACKGKDLAFYEAKAGCNQRRVRQLQDQNSALAARGERDANVTAELDELNRKCVDAAVASHDCSAQGMSWEQFKLDKARADLARDQSNLAQLDGCIKDKNRRSQAGRPQIDPATMGIIMQGLGRSQRQGGGASSGGSSAGHTGHHAK